MSDIKIFIPDKDNEGEWRDIDEGLLDLSSHDAKVRADGYNKAIDDFANLMKEAMEHDWSTTKICDQIIYNNLYDKCNEIAERLKAGVKYEM